MWWRVTVLSEEVETEKWWGSDAAAGSWEDLRQLPVTGICAVILKTHRQRRLQQLLPAPSGGASNFLR